MIPWPPFLKESCEKIERREANASFVARGRGNFLPSKPGGSRVPPKYAFLGPRSSILILHRITKNV
jgi:hypothetical protein